MRIPRSALALPLVLALACGTDGEDDTATNVVVDGGGGSGQAGSAQAGTSGQTGKGGAAGGGGAAGSSGAGQAGQAGTASGGKGGSAGGAGGAGGGAGGAGGASGKGGAGGAPLACDPRFSFSPASPVAGTPFTASFKDAPGYAYIDLTLSGPGNPQKGAVAISGNGPYTWAWPISGHAPGVLSMSFLKDKKDASSPGTLVASCQLAVGGGAGGAGGGGTGGSGTGGSGGSTGGSGGAAGSAGASTSPPANRYGIGLVSSGSAGDFDLAAKLAGPGGHVLVIFADVTPSRHTADPSWKQAIKDAYDRDLVPIVRMAPPWGDRRVRNQGESPTSYKALGQAYRDIVADLPKRAGWPLYVHVHNETNLCYEWACDASVGKLVEDQLASEYAHMLADVADAVHGLGDPRVKVTNGALAPGGVKSCTCGTDQFEGGTTSLTYLAKMKAAVPNVFDKIDVFATHSYPAKGEGWGFFCPMPDSLVGLKYFEKELAAIGKPGMSVLVTETGWSIDGDAGSGCPSSSRDQVAGWTVSAYTSVWETHPNILGVTPFMLRDPSWERFAWTDPGGAPYPVYTQVRAHRCKTPGAGNCN